MTQEEARIELEVAQELAQERGGFVMAYSVRMTDEGFVFKGKSWPDGKCDLVGHYGTLDTDDAVTLIMRTFNNTVVLVPQDVIEAAK